MDIFDILMTIGQIALGLAGFSSILIALSGHPSKWQALDSYRITGMLSVSFLTLLLSLLPSVIVNVGVPPALAWRLCAGIAAVVLIASVGWSRFRYRRLSESDQAASIPVLAASVQAGILLAGLGSAGAAIGVLAPPEGIYLLALFYSIAVACFLIFRFLFARPGP